MKKQNLQKYSFRWILNGRYKVYRDGRILRTAYEVEATDGTIRKYKAKWVKPSMRVTKSGKVTNMAEVYMTSANGAKSKLLVSTVVCYAWWNSYQQDLFNYPYLCWLDGDQSNYDPDNLRLHSEVYDLLPDGYVMPPWIQYCMTFPDGVKYYGQTRDIDLLKHNINRRITQGSDLFERLNLHADENGEATIEVLESIPYNDVDHWIKFQNQEQGFPFQPKREGTIRPKISL